MSECVCRSRDSAACLFQTEYKFDIMRTLLLVPVLKNEKKKCIKWECVYVCVRVCCMDWGLLISVVSQCFSCTSAERSYCALLKLPQLQVNMHTHRLSVCVCVSDISRCLSMFIFVVSIYLLALLSFSLTYIFSRDSKRKYMI